MYDPVQVTGPDLPEIECCKTAKDRTWLATLTRMQSSTVQLPWSAITSVSFGSIVALDIMEHESLCTELHHESNKEITIFKCFHLDDVQAVFLAVN